MFCYPWNIIDLNFTGMGEQASWAHYVLLFLDNNHQWNIRDLNVIVMPMNKQAILIMVAILR